MNQLRENIKELEKDRRLLSERNKQVHSLERDLAVKEDMIHKLLAENEQAQLLASQVQLQHYVAEQPKVQNLLCCSLLLRRLLFRWHSRPWR